MVPFAFGLTANTSGYRRPSGASPALGDHLQPHPCALQQSSSPPRGAVSCGPAPAVPSSKLLHCQHAACSCGSHVLSEKVWISALWDRGKASSPSVLSSFLICALLSLLLFRQLVVSNSLRPHGLHSTPGFPYLLHYLLEFAQTHSRPSSQ